MVKDTPESNIWAPDGDPAIAHIETDLYMTGSSLLMYMHKEIQEALGLTPVPDEVLIQTYQLVSKADPRKRALYRAQNFLNKVAGKTRAEGLRDMYALVESIVQRWYGEGKLRTKAQLAAVKSVMVGKLRAGAEIPQTRGLEAAMDALSSPDINNDRAYFYGQAKSLELVRSIEDQTKAKLRSVMLDYSMGVHAYHVENRLAETFGTLNRDFRAIVVTECASNRSNGFLMECLGEEVEFSASPDACVHCRKYHGKRFKVVMGPGNWDTEIWVGKNNYGRSFSPYTREGRRREDEEMAKPTIGLHTHCRCRWIKVLKKPAMSQELEDYLDYMAKL